MAGNMTDEIKRLSNVLAKDPDSIVFASLADLYLKHGMIDEAIKMSVNGLKKHPNYLKGHRVLADAYLKNGMVHSAKGEYERILELNPDDQDAKDRLASAFWIRREGEPSAPGPDRALDKRAIEASFGEGRVEQPLGTPPEEEIEDQGVPSTEEIAAEEEGLPTLEETLAEVELELEAEKAVKPAVQPVADDMDEFFGEDSDFGDLGVPLEAEPRVELKDSDLPFKGAPQPGQPTAPEPEEPKESFKPIAAAKDVAEEARAPLGEPLEDEEIEKALSAGLLLEKQPPKRSTPEEKAAAASGLDALLRSFETIRMEHGAPPRHVPEKPAVSSLTGLDQTLDDLLHKPGVKAALLVDSSGLVVESASELQIDVEETAALISSVFASSQKTMETLNLGKVDRIAIEVGGKRVYLTKAGDYTLMVETDNTMRLGLLIVLAKKTAESIQELMT